MTSLSQRIYDRLPVLGQNLAVSTYGMMIRRRRRGGEFTRYYNELMESQWFDESEMAELQRTRLRKLVRWACERVPFQRRRFEEAGIDPNRVEGVEDLRGLEVMTSQDLKRLGRALVAEGVQDKIYITHSSGTTGTPTATFVSAEDLRRNYAFRDRSRGWAGLPIERHRTASFGGRQITPIERQHPPFWRYDIVNDKWHYSSYHLSDDNLGAYCEHLARIAPIEIFGYPSSIYAIAAYMRDKGISNVRPKAIITSSETLLEHQRQTYMTNMGQMSRQF